jgi:hypothetical protein
MFRISIGSLVVSNLIPLIGVLFFGRNVSTILILHWSENVIIGISFHKKEHIKFSREKKK